jgi:hypothetical protein
MQETINTCSAEELRAAHEAIKLVIAALRERGVPVPIELHKAAHALRCRLRPKAIRLALITIN